MPYLNDPCCLALQNDIMLILNDTVMYICMKIYLVPYSCACIIPLCNVRQHGSFKYGIVAGGILLIFFCRLAAQICMIMNAMIESINKTEKQFINLPIQNARDTV